MNGNQRRPNMFQPQAPYQSPLAAQQVEPEVAEEAKHEKQRLAEEVQAASPVEEELTPEQKVQKFLYERHNIHPTQIQKWKQEYGQIYLLPFDDDDIYIYRPIRSIEFTNLMLRLRNMPNISDDTSDVELVKLCLIHPKLDPLQFNTLPAGFLSSMRLAIQKASRFLSDEEVASITIRL